MADRDEQGRPWFVEDAEFEKGDRVRITKDLHPEFPPPAGTEGVVLGYGLYHGNLVVELDFEYPEDYDGAGPAEIWQGHLEAVASD